MGEDLSPLPPLRGDSMTEEKKKQEAKPIIEINKEDLEKIIHNVFSDLIKDAMKSNQEFQIVKSPVNGGKPTLVEALRDLIKKEFFKTPRTLNEIVEQLRKDGNIFPVTTVAPVLLNFVRVKLLKREGDRGEYKYFSTG